MITHDQVERRLPGGGRSRLGENSRPDLRWRWISPAVFFVALTARAMVPVLLKRDLLLLRGPLWFSVFSVVKPCLLLWRERQHNRRALRGGDGKQGRFYHGEHGESRRTTERKPGVRGRIGRYRCGIRFAVLPSRLAVLVIVPSAAETSLVMAVASRRADTDKVETNILCCKFRRPFSHSLEGPPSTPFGILDQRRRGSCSSVAAMIGKSGRQVAGCYFTRRRRGPVVAVCSLRLRGLLLSARRSASL